MLSEAERLSQDAALERPVDRGLCIELFSGTGTATQPFEKAGFQVVRIDLVRAFRPTIVADVRYLPLRCRPAFLWASPPCETYSLANRKGRTSDPELWEAAVDSIKSLRPGRWLIENVQGACRTWGVPGARWGPWFLWANFHIRVPRSRAKSKMRFDNPRTRKILRASIPPLLANAVFRSYLSDQRVR